MLTDTNLSATGLPQPDRVIYLTASEKLAKSRSDFGTERYEKVAFQKRVSERFAEISEKDPNLDWVEYEVEKDIEGVTEDLRGLIDVKKLSESDIGLLWDKC